MHELLERADEGIDIGGEARQSFIASAAPDLSTVIESIIKHGETIDEHYATKGLNEVGIVDTESFVPLGASAHLKVQSLPILDNLVRNEINTPQLHLLICGVCPNFECSRKVNVPRDNFDSRGSRIRGRTGLRYS